MRRSKFFGFSGFRTVLVLAAACFLWLAALVPAWAEEGEGTGGVKVPASTCLSGMKWTGGNEGSAEMHPGASCIDCHAKGEGPKFIVAGTVYQDVAERNDCYGVQGVVVQITDAKGKVIRMTTNRAGNFTLRTRGNAITFPYTAKVLFQGREAEMATPQSTGNCASCHTAKGENGAPGRVIAP